MATFVIVELERTQQGTYVEGQKRFEWTSDNRALPRGQIETSLELKKTRDENAAGEPDIQVLAVADGDWSIEGEWSDRFGGQGFAERMREEIEDPARRSSRCRFSIDSFVSDGLLDKVTIRYRLKWRIGYRLDITSFGRPQARQERQVQSKTLSSPAQMFNKIGTLVALIKSAANAAPAAVTKLDTKLQVKTLATDIEAKAATIQGVLAGRVLVTDPRAQNNLERTAGAFRSLASKAAELPAMFASLHASSLNASSDPLSEALTSGWLRDLCSNARATQATALEAAASLTLRAKGSTRALYRPRAGESLYAISNQFYGTPHQWRQIAEVNGLYGMTLTGEELLTIPAAAR